MKKFILLVCFLFVSSLSYSQYTENFNYPTGNLIGNDGWGSTSGAGVIPQQIVSPGLSFPDYAGTGIGNAVRITNTTGTTSGEDDTCRFISSISSGSAYVSLMVNVDSAKTGGDYCFALLNESGSTTTFVGRFFIREVSVGNISFGLSKNNGTADSYVSGYSRNVTYLVILKYTFIAGITNDAVSLFIYSPTDIVPSTEPLPTIGPLSPGGTDLGNVGKVLIRQGGNTLTPSAILDGIYAQDSWNNAVLPVELASFTSIVNKRDVTLNWATSSETNNSGFEIERSVLNGSWSKIGNVAGKGTTLNGHSYSFTDRNLASGNYSYRLKQLDFNGNFEYFNLNNEVNIGIPAKFDLSQNYPNPFNPSTTINFDLPTDGKVSVKLFDMSGKEVAVLVNEVKTAGYYSVNFNASSLSSGVYFYNITADNFTATKKMMLVK